MQNNYLQQYQEKEISELDICMYPDEEKAYNELKEYISKKFNPKTLKKAMEELGIDIPQKSSLPSLYIPWPMNKFMVFRKLVAKYLAKAKPNLEEVIVGVDNKDISWIIGYFWYGIPAKTEDLATAVSSYTHCMHGVYYPDYKYSPKKKTAKQLKQATKELKGVANMIPILHSNVAMSDANYLLCSNNFIDYPFIVNNSVLYPQEGYRYQNTSSRYADYTNQYYYDYN